MSFRRWDTPSPVVQELEEREAQTLARYAMRSRDSAGRRHAEPEHPYRGSYVRDRDRIIHSAAFRRLLAKTQVFVGQPDDHQRTRLTHTLEVAQIARTVARNLALNEDLTEAVALAHDLGHPPFGHAGERALAECMASHGGFEHNRQGLRLLERLEDRYPSFPGLNLTYEVLESVALHSRERAHPELAEFHPEHAMLAESQAVDVADSIAYDAHDLDDAIRAGLITLDDLRETTMIRQAEERARATYGPTLEGKQLTRAILRSLIDWQVSGLLVESRRRLESLETSLAVQRHAAPVIAVDEETAGIKRELEAFLFARVYRHRQVARVIRVAERMVRALFEEIIRDLDRLPEHYRARVEAEGRERVVADYVAGMTDRFAQRLHRQLFEP